MKILRWALRLHKWIALIIGLQIFIWVGTGLYFSIFPIEEIRGNYKKTEWSVQPFDPAKIVSLELAVRNAGAKDVKSAKLGHMMGRPVWRLSVSSASPANTDDVKTITVDGRSGQVLSPITEALAAQIAKADYSGPGKFQSVTYLEISPQEASAGGDPRWAARFDDSENTILYINPDSAEVASSRSTKWRIFDFFWKLHIMDYDDGENFNHPLLIVAAITALIVVLLGFVLLFIRMRRLWLMRRSKRS